MADGDLVRKITISANGENIESTKASVDALSAATVALTASNDNYKKQTDSLAANGTGYWTDLAAKVGLAAAAFVGLKSAASGASDAVGSAYNATISTLGAILSYIPKKLGEEWDAGNKQLQSYVDLATRATRMGVSADYYQTITAAANASKISNEALLATFDRLKDTTADTLGGSTGQNRVDQLTGAGNFKGNTGVEQLANANTAEEKYKAVVSLINQAMTAGERLAGLDVAKTFLGEDVAKSLAKDSDYLDKMQQSADKIILKDLVPDDAVSNALSLKNRMQAASDILAKEWFPAQQNLHTLGIAFQTVWVNIVEYTATAFGWVNRLVDKLVSVPSTVWEKLKDGYSILTTGYKQPEGPVGQAVDPMDTARQRLINGLKNPSTVDAARDQVNNIQNSVFKDKSKDPNAKKPDAPDTSSYDRATESLRKYVETSNAAASSIDLTADAQERFKAIAQLTAAGMKDGLTREAATLRAQLNGLTVDAGNAALALEKARVASSIKFNAATAFLSQEDVSIASQLRKIYPDVATAINSVEASQIRYNNTLKDLNDTALSTTKSFATDFTSALRSGSSAWGAFEAAGTSALTKISDKLMNMAIDNLWSKAMGGSTGGLASLFGRSSELPGFGTSSFVGPLPGYANGTNDAPGGWSTVGENGPEKMYVPKGATIVPNGVAANDNGPVNVSYAPVYNVTGVGEDIDRLRQQMAQDRAEFASKTIAVVKKAQSGRIL